MLVGMRSMLKAGGKAFVTLPRSCLDHSFTLCEESFCDVLASVGLCRLNKHHPERTPDSTRSGGGGSLDAPASSKIVYFECIAGLPSAEAAVRVQHARHEARASHRAADSSQRAKSAGAAFDVDVGGTLGFGVRVARSYDPVDAGRRAKEQVLVRTEFVRRYAETSAEAVAEALTRSSTHDAHAPVSAPGTAVKVGDGAEHDLPSVAGLAGLAAIEEQLDRTVQRGASRLDYSHWRWYPGGAAEDRLPFWRHLADGMEGSSAQAHSGWQWSAAGWVQSAAANELGHQQPPTTCDQPGACQTSTEHCATKPDQKSHDQGSTGEQRLIKQDHDRPSRRQKHRALQARVSSVGGCWWRGS